MLLCSEKALDLEPSCRIKLVIRRIFCFSVDDPSKDEKCANERRERQIVSVWHCKDDDNDPCQLA